MFPQLTFGGIPVTITSYLPMDWWYCEQNGKLYARSEAAVGKLVEQLTKAVEDQFRKGGRAADGIRLESGRG